MDYNVLHGPFGHYDDVYMAKRREKADQGLAPGKKDGTD